MQLCDTDTGVDTDKDIATTQIQEQAPIQTAPCIDASQLLLQARGSDSTAIVAATAAASVVGPTRGEQHSDGSTAA